jgi:hypothetical protein
VFAIVSKDVIAVRAKFPTRSNKPGLLQQLPLCTLLKFLAELKLATWRRPSSTAVSTYPFAQQDEFALDHQHAHSNLWREAVSGIGLETTQLWGLTFELSRPRRRGA